jgi:hypothetical protein
MPQLVQLLIFHDTLFQIGFSLAIASQQLPCGMKLLRFDGKPCFFTH